jgi:zinc/manganese transport system permease protein
MDGRWNLVADLREMWSLPFMVNAFRAGTIVAVVAGVIGYFMVLRRQAFAGHTLYIVGFPGATGAIWLGVSATYGYYTFCIAAALIIAAVPSPGQRMSEESALIGTVQSYALACGALFLALFNGLLGNTYSLLFGSFLGITTSQVNALAVVGAIALVAVVVAGRPLLFASVDPSVAEASGVPVRWLDVGFLVLLGVTVAAVAPITGVLLVFTLLVLPPATAQRLTNRPVPAICLSVAIGLLTTWVSLTVAFYTPYPFGFWLSTIAFGLYVVTVAATSLGQVRSRHVASSGALA